MGWASRARVRRVRRVRSEDVWTVEATWQLDGKKGTCKGSKCKMKCNCKVVKGEVVNGRLKGGLSVINAVTCYGCDLCMLPFVIVFLYFSIL
jgi:NAD-dependent dihydropyrimidine dehydrogenase PreA subunit